MMRLQMCFSMVPIDSGAPPRSKQSAWIRLMREQGKALGLAENIAAETGLEIQDAVELALGQTLQIRFAWNQSIPSWRSLFRLDLVDFPEEGYEKWTPDEALIYLEKIRQCMEHVMQFPIEAQLETIP